MFWIDQKYITLLSPRLSLFKRVENNYNFRCPYCGDSSKNKFKSRGYLIQRESSYSYYCHNCGQTASLRQFIKHVDPQLYSEFVRESYLNANTAPDTRDIPEITAFKQPVFDRNASLKKLKKISQLKWDHPAKLYVEKRKIPNPYHAKLFYAPNFAKWVNETLDYQKLDPANKEPRLVIPFLSEDKRMHAFQGRSFSKTGVRYITIVTDESMPKLYGLDTVDQSKKVYVFEGPIDSMFIPNSIAMAGSAAPVEFDNCVFVYDNEPRNQHIVKRIEKTIDEGHSVCLWPHQIGYKDVNDMILGGLTVESIKQIIDNNTYNGLEAKLAITNWKKI